MKKNISRFFLSMGLGIALLTGCKKQLDIAPTQSIDAGTALTSRDAINASITSIYARLKNARQYGRDMIIFPDALADNGFATNRSGRFLAETQNTPPGTWNSVVWTNSYAAINQINLTLTALPSLSITPAVSAAERANWEGQLYFLRGLYYFDLVRVYAYIPGAVVDALNRGGVVILPEAGVSTAAGAVDFKPSRAPIDTVYTQIVNDFTLANARLAVNNGASGASIATKGSTQGMLAKVNLYRKNFPESKRWADSCITISGSKMTTAANYVSNWRNDTHGETLFQVRFATNGENTGVNESLQTSLTSLVTLPGSTSITGGFGDLIPTLTLLSDLGITLTGGNTTTAFALAHSVASRSTDVRNLLYETGTAGRGPVKVECTKYLGKAGFINLDHAPVLRISEVFLIRAEAQAASGSSVANVTNALADLKFVKSRRYSDYAGSAQETADGAMSQAALFEEVIRQRRLELAFEGNRSFDLKRLGRDYVKTPHYTTVAFTDTRILPPIPQFDIDGNPNLKQNPGY